MLWKATSGWTASPGWTRTVGKHQFMRSVMCSSLRAHLQGPAGSRVASLSTIRALFSLDEIGFAGFVSSRVATYPPSANVGNQTSRRVRRRRRSVGQRKARGLSGSRGRDCGPSGSPRFSRAVKIPASTPVNHTPSACGRASSSRSPTAALPAVCLR